MFSGTTILAWVDSDLVDVDQIMTPGQVTDSYLLALAVKNRGQLATFDRLATVLSQQAATTPDTTLSASLYRRLARI